MCPRDGLSTCQGAGSYLNFALPSRKDKTGLNEYPQAGLCQDWPLVHWPQERHTPGPRLKCSMCPKFVLWVFQKQFKTTVVFGLLWLTLCIFYLSPQERFQVKNPPAAYIQKLKSYLDTGGVSRKVAADWMSNLGVYIFLSVLSLSILYPLNSWSSCIYLFCGLV